VIPGFRSKGLKKMSAGPAHLCSSQLWSVFGRGLAAMMALTCPGDSLIFTRHCPLKNHFHLRRDRSARSSSFGRLMFELVSVFRSWALEFQASVRGICYLWINIDAAAGRGVGNICKIARQHCKQSVSRFVVVSGNNHAPQKPPPYPLKRH